MDECDLVNSSRPLLLYGNWGGFAEMAFGCSIKTARYLIRLSVELKTFGLPLPIGGVRFDV